MDGTKKVYQAVATITAYSISTKIISLIFKIYTSRVLGAEMMGLYQICTSVFYLFASLTASGLPLVLSRKIAEGRAINNTDGNAELLTGALIVGGAVSLVMIGLLYLLRDYLGSLFSDKRSLPLFMIIMPALFSTTVYYIIRSYFWGSKQYSRFAFTEMLEEVMRIVISVLLIVGIISSVSGAYTVTYAFLISDILICIILIIMYFSYGGRLSKKPKYKEVIKPALPITLMRIFSSLSVTFVALLFPLRLMQSGLTMGEATASYGRISGMANPLILAPMSFLGALSVVLIPEMSEKCAKKEFPALNRQINNGLEFSFLISGLFLLCYIALGEQITALLYKDANSGKYLQWASFLMMPLALSQLIQSAMHSMGLERKSFTNYIIGTLAMFACVYFLPPYLGIYSVALASFLSLTISGILNLLTLKKYTGLKMEFLRSLLVSMVFALVCAYFANSLYSLIQGVMGSFALVLSLAAGAAMYAAFAVATDTVKLSTLRISRAK